MKSFASLLAVLVIALVPATVLAQDGVESNLPGAGFDTPNTSESAAPTIHVYSRETILDVLVKDDKGKPVRGLKRSDFTVKEDDKPQPLRGFSEFDGGAAVAPVAPLPPNTYSNSQTLPASGPVQIFYFDLPFGCSFPPGTEPPADFAQCAPWVGAKPYIADYFRTMPAGTQVAVFAFRYDWGLRLIRGFSTDGPGIAAAIDKLVVSSPGKSSSTNPYPDPIAAADEIAAYVAGIHGRKNLIWIGTPLDISRDGGLSGHPERPPDMTYVHRLMDTYDHFTAEQIAIYPFDPIGVRRRSLRGATALLRIEEIASGTGGVAVYNTNDFKGAAAKIVEDSSHYYTLSYVPPRLMDDNHYHPIKITVDRPGMHLTYRGGYNSEVPAPPDAVLKIQMTQNTMGPDALPMTQLVFDAKVTQSQVSEARLAAGNTPTRKMISLAGKRPVSYDTLFTLEPGQITFAEGVDRTTFNAALEFDLIAYDSGGKAVAVRSQTMKLPLTPEEHQAFVQTPFKFFLPIDLPPGDLTLRLGVFDTVSSKAGTLEIPLRVRASDSAVAR